MSGIKYDFFLLDRKSAERQTSLTDLRVSLRNRGLPDKHLSPEIYGLSDLPIVEYDQRTRKRCPGRQRVGGRDRPAGMASESNVPQLVESHFVRQYLQMAFAMLVAILAVHIDKGLFVANNGYEFGLALFAVAVSLAAWSGADILVSGWHLMRESVGGLMDEAVEPDRSTATKARC